MLGSAPISRCTSCDARHEKKADEVVRVLATFCSRKELNAYSRSVSMGLLPTGFLRQFAVTTLGSRWL